MLVSRNRHAGPPASLLEYSRPNRYSMVSRTLEASPFYKTLCSNWLSKRGPCTHMPLLPPGLPCSLMCARSGVGLNPWARPCSCPTMLCPTGSRSPASTTTSCIPGPTAVPLAPLAPNPDTEPAGTHQAAPEAAQVSGRHHHVTFSRAPGLAPHSPGPKPRRPTSACTCIASPNARAVLMPTSGSGDRLHTA
jgi:hypothetical protein